MEILVTSYGPVVLNETQAASVTQTIDEESGLEIRTSTVVQPQIGALYTEKVVVEAAANIAPAGPPGPKGDTGDPGVHIGSTPPANLDQLWVKI